MISYVGGIPIIGVPARVMFYRIIVLDLVLQRMSERVVSERLVDMPYTNLVS